MVTCFKTVSNKCSVNYIKTTAIILRNECSAITSCKPVQYLNIRKKSDAVNNIAIHNNSHTIKQFNYFNYVSKFQNTAFSYKISHNLTKIYGCVILPHKEYHKIMMSSISDKKSTQSTESFGRPSPEQLEVVFTSLSDHLPKALRYQISLDIFHKDIILENNIRKTRHVGITKYSVQLVLLKMLLNIKFAYFNLQILKITKHPEDGTIKCRWRIVGYSGITVILQVWKFLPQNFKETLQKAPTWYDGFSIYYVGSDGLVHKHVIDKMMPDDDNIPVSKPTITPKVALYSELNLKDKNILFSNEINNSRKNS